MIRRKPTISIQGPKYCLGSYLLCRIVLSLSSLAFAMEGILVSVEEPNGTVNSKKYRPGIKKRDLLSALQGRHGVGDLKNSEDYDIEPSDEVVDAGAYKYFLSPSPSAGKERSPKRSKTSGNGFSESVNVVMQKWKSKLSTFLGTFVEKRCELPEKSGVPCNHRGPSILLDKLTEGWTKDVGVLWERLKDSSRGIVPVMGVSGSGKTRFLYELLAENWGFFWTATTRGNGGSCDVGTMLFRQVEHDTAENHRIARGRMRCAILSRLLILQFCVKEIPTLKPLQWLMLQVQFRAFSDEACEDPYDMFTIDLASEVVGLKDLEGLDAMIGLLWTELEMKLKCSFILVMDEAQVLGDTNKGCYKSPKSQELRSIFSPVIEALINPSKRLRVPKVFVAGTGLSFMKLEDAIGSAIAKGGVEEGPAQFVSAPFSSWTDVPQVLKFCQRYLKLEDGHEEDNAHYLLEKFRGRRRCLVSCVEHLLSETGGIWEESVVDRYFKEITSDSNVPSSIYYAVEKLCGSEGTFFLRGESLSADLLVRSIGFSFAFAGRGQYTVSTDGDMTLLERGLGQLTRMSGSNYIFSIFEPTVHHSIINYLTTNALFEKIVKDLMVYCGDDSSAMGRAWEKLFTFYVPKLFDGTKFLADMCCFKDATMPQDFTRDKAMITGEVVGVWRESYLEHTVSEFLDTEEKSRPQCLIFDDRSGADVLFVVRLGNLKIPVFCQLKLRSQVEWVSAVATTDPALMYKKKDRVEFRKRVVAASKDGCIRLVVAYPAKKSTVSKATQQHNHLLGYIGKEEMEILFGDELCGFLSSIKDLQIL